MDTGREWRKKMQAGLAHAVTPRITVKDRLLLSRKWTVNKRGWHHLPNPPRARLSHFSVVDVFALKQCCVAKLTELTKKDVMFIFEAPAETAHSNEEGGEKKKKVREEFARLNHWCRSWCFKQRRPFSPARACRTMQTHANTNTLIYAHLHASASVDSLPPLQLRPHVSQNYSLLAPQRAPLFPRQQDLEEVLGLLYFISILRFPSLIEKSFPDIFFLFCQVLFLR